MKTKEDALCLPFSDNFRKLRSYILKKKIHLTVMESLSGSMKSNALAMATKTSSLMRSGMLYLSEQEEVAGVNGGEVEG
jgi:nicotinamide mononucleotide (NMN) deamidase PncC